jgi:cytoskeletal protein CcmA (bactofilin family)
MHTGCCCKIRKMLHCVLVSKAGGSSLLWAIGALVFLSVVGTTVALLSPSALQSKLEQEAGMKAYYNANAGLNYILGEHESSVMSNVTFANYVSSMGNGAYVNYSIDGSDGFYFALGNIVSSNSNNTYQITSLVGTALKSSDKNPYAYVLYGGGKGASPVFTYAHTPIGATKYVIYAANAKVSIQGAAVVVGDVYAKSLDVSMATVTGDVITVKNANLGFATTLNGSLCSGGDVTLDQSSVSQTINAIGDIDFKFASQVGGDVFSGGKITTASSVRLNSDINAYETISLGWKTSISKDAYSGGVDCKKCNIDFDGSSVSIGNNAYANKNINMSWDSSIGGVAVAQKVNGDSVGSKIETTTYPPNIRPKPPTPCRSDNAPKSPGYDDDSTVDIIIPWASTLYDKSNPLPPGKYRNLKIDSSAVITFTSGVYYFNSVSTGWANTINYDVSAGDVTILVVGGIAIGGSNSVNVKTKDKDFLDMSAVDKDEAAKVYWESKKSGFIGWGTDWFGTMFTQDSITLDGANNHVIGALVTAGTVSNIDWAADVYYVPANYSKKYWY